MKWDGMGMMEIDVIFGVDYSVWSVRVCGRQ